LPVVLIDDQGGAARADPDQVIAQGEDFAHLRLAFDNLEVGRAHGLDRDGLHLGIELLVNPDAADFQAIALVDHARSSLGHAGPVAQVVRLHGQIDAELAGLDACQLAAHKELARFVKGFFLFQGFLLRLPCLARCRPGEGLGGKPVAAPGHAVLAVRAMKLLGQILHFQSLAGEPRQK